MSTVNLLVGRQPIFDRASRVLGYELLFAPGAADHDVAEPQDRDLAWAELLFGSVGIGLEQLVGTKLAYCDATPAMLRSDAAFVLPPTQTVIEVPESCARDPEALAGCRRLAYEGFSLAVDHYTGAREAEGLLDVAALVKVDAGLPEGPLREIAKRCYNRCLRLGATGIRDQAELERCRALGIHLYQGDFLSEPRVAHGQVLSTTQLARLRLAAKVMDPDYQLKELESIIRRDAALSHQLLKLAGLEATTGMVRTVRSIQEALVLVGWRRLKSWVALLLVADPGSASEEQIVTAMVRARMTELLAEAMVPDQTDVGFTVGLLSSLEMLLGVPLETALADLPLAYDVRDSVLHRNGPVGALLSDVIEFQRGHPERSTHSGARPGILQFAHLKALAWGVEIAGGIEAGAAA
ncbi:MAG TPA: EAL domain-containing protein [Acidimicrobiales bacterium]|nr:EAL domain-containing protein [Acidimicrobiales bacterium]